MVTKGVNMPKIKCAIYVRKSTEKGLDMEFNSLHNQEDSCRSYIASQSFNNWEYYKTYTDGGISGGTMERPALQQMLNDIEHGLIQIVVVYKVDRLSRPIMDFHNMIKRFEKYNCDFVSITQAFDTSSSMGKLTLNMLLSFAQFEREVSSERVRDKIRASKAKGLWTGGMPKLGYDIINRKLEINLDEADQVKFIFETYLIVGSLSELSEITRGRNITMKKWTTQTGHIMGGGIFSTSSLNRLLHEKLYIGKIENKRTKQFFDGQHAAIISPELFDAVQQKLSDQNRRKTETTKQSNNLLSGKIFNANGRAFTNQSTTGSDKRYYASPGFYIPAHDAERIATETIVELLDADLSKLPPNTAMSMKQIDFNGLEYLQQRELIKSLIAKIIYANNQMTFFIKPDPAVIRQFATNTINENNTPMDFIIDNNTIIIKRDIVFMKGISSNKYNAGKTGMLTITDNNHLITRAFVIAWRFRKIYEEHGDTKLLAKMEKTSLRNVFKYLNIAYL